MIFSAVSAVVVVPSVASAVSSVVSMAVASVVGLTNNMLLVLPVTILSAVLLLRTGQNTKIKGDAAVTMISVGTLAIGYMLMNLILVFLKYL